MELCKTNITVYSNVSLVYPPQIIPLEDFLVGVKKPSQRIQSVIQQIRSEKDASRVRELKTKLLPVACVSGVFSSRKDESIKVPSNIVCIDVDHVADVVALKNEMKECEHVVAVFDSPTGHGSKILLSHDLKDMSLHPALYRHLGDFLGLAGRSDLKFDSSCQNISHPCFFSYDKNIYINRKATQYNVDESVLTTMSTVSAHASYVDTPDDVVYKAPLTDYKEIRSKVKDSHDLFEKYHSMYPGTRNMNLYLLACFFRQDGIPEEFASDYLVAYYADDEFSPKEIRKTIKSAYHIF